jgi:transposase
VHTRFWLCAELLLLRQLALQIAAVSDLRARRADRSDIGRADRFQRCRQIASYLGLVPLEESSGQRRRLGHITKQGNSLLCFLLVEAAQVWVRSDPEWRSKYFHPVMRRGRKIAKVAMARRLAVRLYWM